MEKYYFLKRTVVVRQSQNLFFILDATQDYSKKGVPQITRESLALLEYLREPRTLTNILSDFKYSEDDQQQTIEFLNYLVKGGYLLSWIIGDNQNTSFVSKIISDDWYQKSIPYGATIELLPNCNFSCVHCYLTTHRNTDKPLSTLEIKSIFDKLKEIGIFYLFLSGGEPLLREDFIELYIYARKSGFLVTVFTNGYLINDELLDVFSIYPPMELDISLYGGCDKTYERVTGIKDAFSRVSENMLEAKKRGIFVSAKSPIMTITEPDIPLMTQFCKSHGIPFRMFYDIHQTIDQETRNEYNIDLYEAVQLYKKYNYENYLLDLEAYKKYQKKTSTIKRKRFLCGTGRNSCFVDYKGNIFPCIHTRHRGISIFSKDIQSIWEETRAITYECLQNNEDYSCLHCPLIPICKSCPALREATYGSPLIISDTDCAWARALEKEIKKGENGDV